MGTSPTYPEEFLLFHSDSVIYNFAKLWLPYFRKVNTSMIHKTGKGEKITRPADFVSTQRVMSSATAVYAQKLLRGLA